MDGGLPQRMEALPAQRAAPVVQAEGQQRLPWVHPLEHVTLAGIPAGVQAGPCLLHAEAPRSV